MNVRQARIQTTIKEVRAEEVRLIHLLEKEHQIVDCVALLECLHERKVLSKILEMERDTPTAQAWKRSR